METVVVGHSRVEDVVGVVTGAFVASLGLFLLDVGGAVTGGTAGLGLLVAHLGGWSVGAVYLAVSAPFAVLAVARKGWPFALRSLAALGLVAVFSLVHPVALGEVRPAPVYATLVGDLALGIGILILFRHGTSLGGFTVVALLCQERLGWRAGYVQLGFDAVIVALSALVVPVGTVLVSAVGVVVLNLVLAMNHRPGRYLGA